MHNFNYTVKKEERMFFNSKIEEVYLSHGKHIEVISESPFYMCADEIAYMQHEHNTGEFSFKCGQFWYEEENILPVIAMAHELGHYRDVTNNFDGDMWDYMKTLGTLESEVRAWELGIEVCKEIGLDMKETILNYAEKCLSTYYSAWMLPNDYKTKFQGKKPTFNEAMTRIKQALGLLEDTEKPTMEMYMNKRKQQIEQRKELKKTMRMKAWEL